MISTIPSNGLCLSHQLLKIEKTNIFQIFGVICVFYWCDTYYNQSQILNLLVNLDFNKGDLTMVVAMFSWATYSALVKEKENMNYHNYLCLKLLLLCGLIFLIPIYIIRI